MNSLQIKNWLSLVKNRLRDKEKINDAEIQSFIQELELFIINIEEMHKRLAIVEQKFEDIENFDSSIKKKKSSKSKTLEEDYIQTILTKILILKNIIKRDIITDDSLLSPQLAVVESIENDIKSKKSVNKNQLEELNLIYNNQRMQGKI